MFVQPLVPKSKTKIPGALLAVSRLAIFNLRARMLSNAVPEGWFLNVVIVRTFASS